MDCNFSGEDMTSKILATASGWLIATKVIRETPKAFICEHEDNRGRLKEHRVSKSGLTQRLFDNTDEALAWIGGES